MTLKGHFGAGSLVQDPACIWLLVAARRVSWLVRNTPQDVGRIERFPGGPSILTLGSKSPRDKAVAE